MATTERTGSRGAGLKILSMELLAAELGSQRRQGRSVALCHGVFDLLHIGHIRHLEEAATMADVLVVTLTPDEYVNKGPSRPAFAQRLRAEAVAALACVDYVAINKWPTAVETIKLLKPKVFVKGPDYKDPSADRTGGIIGEARAVQDVGGRIVTTDNIVFSSSSLINEYLSSLPEETLLYLRRFKSSRSSDDVVRYLDGCTDIRALVIGETIIDEYQYCTAIGKSSKEPTLAVKLESIDAFAGGALAAANHVAGFSRHVGVLTAMGNEPERLALLEQRLDSRVNRHVHRRRSSPTIVKRRIVDRYFFHKLLEVYEFDGQPLGTDEEAEIRNDLEASLPNYDVVIVMDFGHGLLTPRIVDDLISRAKFLAINVQSNAGNLGYNTLSKYSRADYVAVTETELRLDARDRYGSLSDMMVRTSQRLGCKQLAVTQGKDGCSVFDRNVGVIEAPALATKVVDRLGAGDAFMAVTSLCSAQGAPADVTAFVGNVVGAEATGIVGNSRAVDKLSVVRHLQTLMK